MIAPSTSGSPGFSPAERPRVAIASDGTLAAIADSTRVAVLELPGAAPFASVDVDPAAAANEIAWVGAPPRLLVLSRYVLYSAVRLIDPYGPRTIAEIRLESPMQLVAAVGTHALAVSATGAVVLTASDTQLTQSQFPVRAVPVAAGGAAGNFVVALAESIEEWDPQTRMPKRRLRLPEPAVITAVGGSDRAVWMTTQDNPARLDVIPLVNRGQPAFHDLPEPIAQAVGHPRSDLVVCVGAESGRLFVVDLDGRSRLRILEPEGIDHTDAAALIVGRMAGVLVAQEMRPVVIVALDAGEPTERPPQRTGELPVIEGVEPRPRTGTRPPPPPPGRGASRPTASPLPLAESTPEPIAVVAAPPAATRPSTPAPRAASESISIDVEIDDEVAPRAESVPDPIVAVLAPPIVDAPAPSVAAPRASRPTVPPPARPEPIAVVSAPPIVETPPAAPHASRPTVPPPARPEPIAAAPEPSVAAPRASRPTVPPPARPEPNVAAQPAARTSRPTGPSPGAGSPPGANGAAPEPSVAAPPIATAPPRVTAPTPVAAEARAAAPTTVATAPPPVAAEARAAAPTTVATAPPLSPRVEAVLSSLSQRAETRPASPQAAPPSAPANIADSGLSEWRDKLRQLQSRTAQASLPGIDPDPSWRDDVFEWASSAIDGSTDGDVPAAPSIDAIAVRFDLSLQLVPALVLLYGAHLGGARGAAPIDVARVLGGRWDEALGRGELAERGLAIYVDSRVILAPPIRRALDELPVTTGTLVGNLDEQSLIGPCVVVAGDEPLSDVAERCLARAGGAILAAHDDADPLELFIEARARGAAPMLRVSLGDIVELGSDPAILVVDNESIADQLGVPRLR